jgi:hypothetical protein
MKRTIKKTKIQQTKAGQYIITLPSWIVEKVLQAEKGSELEWDFQGDKAILKKY